MLTVFTVFTVSTVVIVLTLLTVETLETVETEELKKYELLTDNLKSRDASASKKPPLSGRIVSPNRHDPHARDKM